MKNNVVKIAAFALVYSGFIACSPKSSEDEITTEQITATTETEVTNTAPAASGSGFDVTGKDTITLASGLKYILINEGTGHKPSVGKTVSVHYTGYLTDGTKFDSSIDRGAPIQFALGIGQVIRGWDEGIALLNKGSKARLIIPHELGYGTEGYPPLIPPSATLIFDIELVGAE